MEKPGGAPHILIADDEQDLTEYLTPLLTRRGFEVTVANDGLKALESAIQQRPDLIVLDVMMPHLDGHEVCRRLRAAGHSTPIIMLTHVVNQTDKVSALEEGADDYLCKPFDPLELIARIRAVLRRRERNPSQPPLHTAMRLRSDDLLLDRRSRRAMKGNQLLKLTPRAWSLLEYLMLHPDEVLTRDQLLDAVWGWDYVVATRAVDVRIAELRQALGRDESDSPFIETVTGIGYRFLGAVEAG